MSAPAGTLRVSEVLDVQPALSRRQWMVLGLCFASLVLDGFDVQVIGYLAPAIIADWGIEKAALTPVFTAGLLGMLVGSFVLSWLADRIGRRPLLIASSVMFGLCMIATAYVQTLEQLVAMRFVTGLGLGGIMPNAMALSGEFVPQRMRVTVMMTVACGFTIGAALGGFIAVALVDLAGWRSVFTLGGLMPLLLAMLMAKELPESLQFQLLRGLPANSIAQSLRRIAPGWTSHAERTLVADAQVAQKGRIADLFAAERRSGTLVIWAANFMNLLILYFVSSWLPTLLTRADYPQDVAIMAATCVQLGGIAGTLSMGRVIDRIGFRTVLPMMFVLAALALSVAGRGLEPGALYLVFAAIGFCIMGGQPALNSMSASFYPVSIRSTGIGWGLGVGRFGSVLGPIVGGALIAREASNAEILSLLAAPAVILAVLVAVMPIQRSE